MNGTGGIPKHSAIVVHFSCESLPKHMASSVSLPHEVTKTIPTLTDDVMRFDGLELRHDPLVSPRSPKLGGNPLYIALWQLVCIVRT